MAQLQQGEPYATLAVAAYALASMAVFRSKDSKHGSCRHRKLTTALNQTSLRSLICRASLPGHLKEPTDRPICNRIASKHPNGSSSSFISLWEAPSHQPMDPLAHD
jgi:hypothetical protein